MTRLFHVPTADELIDKAFRRAARARRGKPKRTRAERVRAEWAFLMTASTILSDTLASIPKRFPSLQHLPAHERRLIDVLVGEDGLRRALGSLGWAAEQITQIRRQAVGELKRADEPNVIRRRASGRMVSVVRQVEKSLKLVGEARSVIERAPTLEDVPTIVVSGFPNVGKSSFVGAVSTASPEVAPYPFTTRHMVVGHALLRGMRVQLVDIPGLFALKPSEKKMIEMQAAAVLGELGDVVLFLLDTTGSCGYGVDEQLELLGELKEGVDVPVVVAGSKRDHPDFVHTPEMDIELSVYEPKSVEAVLERVVGLAVEKREKERAEPSK
ncbi:MAG: NOG1 family protein [Methermicoccaceae archaeon]